MAELALSSLKPRHEILKTATLASYRNEIEMLSRSNPDLTTAAIKFTWTSNLQPAQRREQLCKLSFHRSALTSTLALLGGRLPFHTGYS